MCDIGVQGGAGGIAGEGASVNAKAAWFHCRPKMNEAKALEKGNPHAECSERRPRMGIMPAS